MAISGSVSSISQIKGSISQGNELVVTRVAVPGPQGPQGVAGSSVNNISQAQDVDVSALQDEHGRISTLIFQREFQRLSTEVIRGSPGKNNRYPSMEGHSQYRG